MQGLSRENILNRLRPEVLRLIAKISVLDSTDSTNLELNRADIEDRIKICVANQQTRGKGRQEKTWVSPPDCNIYLSLSRKFNLKPDELSGLALVVGITVAETLNDLHNTDKIKLKWPNDLIANDKKLGGILLENHLEQDFNSKVVIGIGINHSMPDTDIDVPWINLNQIAGKKTRNQIISCLINRLVPEFFKYNQNTLANFIKRWKKLDWTLNLPVNVFGKTANISGIARGIDNKGALLLENNTKIRRVFSGDISLRKI